MRTGVSPWISGFQSCVASYLWIVLVLLLPFMGWGATIQSNGTGGGNWNAGGSWNGGVMPAPGDNVLILVGDQINATTSQSCVNLQINGSLNFNTNGVTISPTGNLTFSGTGSILGSNASRSLNVTGNMFSLSGAAAASQVST